MRKVLLLVVFLLLLQTCLMAAIPLTDKISIDGTVRYRTEIDGKDFNSDTGMNDYATLRTQIGIRIEPNDQYFVYAKFKEARSWGQQGVNKAATTNFYAEQVYFETKKLFSSDLHLRVGRYPLVFGRSRIIGAANFNVYGPRTYDAIGVLSCEESMKWEMHYTKSDGTTTPGEFGKHDLHMFIGRAQLLEGKVEPLLWVYYDSRVLDPAYVTPAYEDPNLWITPGVFLKYKSGAIKGFLDFAAQFGKNDNRDLSAFLFAADVFYAIDNSMKPSVGIGVDYTTGTTADDIADEKDHTFRVPFMSRHTYRGYMDYFKDENPGLMSILLHFEMYPMEKLRMNIDFHNFSYLDKQPSASDPGSDYTLIGQEVDIRFRLPLIDSVGIDAAHCIFLPSDDFINDGDMSHYTYIALTAKF